MKKKILDVLKNPVVIICAIVMLAIGLFLSYKYGYIPYKQTQEGWVSSNSWDCPADHPIKGNLHSMIYHTKSSRWYSKTNGRNCECFDTEEHAKAQGFRAPLR